MQVECLRDWPGVGGWEKIFYKYSAAVVLNGHVHAYQRSKPVYAYEINPKGAVYITVGDGGGLSCAVVFCTLRSSRPPWLLGPRSTGATVSFDLVFVFFKAQLPLLARVLVAYTLAEAGCSSACNKGVVQLFVLRVTC